MTNSLIALQEETLRALADKIDDFYLAGGTALSRYYFQHRVSEDLDFFTQTYSRPRIQELASRLAAALGKKIELTAEQVEKEKVRMAVYFIRQRKAGLKIDFVEDYLKLLQPCRNVDGIFILSLPDIYLRKIYTLTGTIENVDAVGRKVSAGRQEPKDFYDLYLLSHTFKRLSDFAWEHCRGASLEALIHWYRTYDRITIKSGLLDLQLTHNKALDFRKIDAHFKKEIDQVLEKEIGKI